jgi:hypothetical protein
MNVFGDFGQGGEKQSADNGLKWTEPFLVISAGKMCKP